jgi:hypothetical protein
MPLPRILPSKPPRYRRVPNNVIESVFSGMARAIIHNSDYKTADDAKTAINRYFEERNTHFKRSPRRAGNKIWRKEREPPVFSDAHNCKDPRYR